jgi:aconitate hydratase
MSLAGTLNFNPLTDTLKDKDGNEFMLKEPTGAGLPANGYVSNPFEKPMLIP